MRFFLVASLLLHLAIIYFLYLSNGLKLSQSSDVEIAVIENTIVHSPTDLESENIVTSPYEKIQKATFPEITAETEKTAPAPPPPAQPVVTAKAPTAISATAPVEPPQVKSFSSSDLGLKVKYPRLSRMLAEEGRVVVLIFTNEKGHITKMSVNSSSGFARLDEAALDAVSNSHATTYDKSSRIKISFHFKLK